MITSKKKFYACVNDIAQNVHIKYWSQPAVRVFLRRIGITPIDVACRLDNLIREHISKIPHRVRTCAGVSYPRLRASYLTLLAPAINLYSPGKNFKKVSITYDDGSTAQGVTGNMLLFNLSANKNVQSCFKIIDGPIHTIKTALGTAYNLEDPYTKKEPGEYVPRLGTYLPSVFSLNSLTYKCYRLTNRFPYLSTPFVENTPGESVWAAGNGSYPELLIEAYNNALLGFSQDERNRNLRTGSPANQEWNGGMRCCVCLHPETLQQFLTTAPESFAEEASQAETKLLDIINSYST